MKNLYKLLCITLLFSGLISCNDDDNFALQAPSADFAIQTPLSGNRVVLDGTNPDNVALTITWNDPKNQGQSMSYNVEVAEFNTDFAQPIIAGTTTSNTIEFTVAQLNTFLLDEVQVNPNVELAYDLRVVAANGETSNVITVVFTPYLVIVEELYLNLSSTDFDVSQAVPMGMTDVNKFEKTITLEAGEEFNYTESTTSSDIVWKKLDDDSNQLTKYGGVNFSVEEAGLYNLKVDLNNFTYEVNIILYPRIYVVGNFLDDSGYGSEWNAEDAVPIASAGIGETNYEGYVFMNTSSPEYKILPTLGTFNGDYGDDGSFSGILIQEGEVNCTLPSAGYYFIKADTNAGTYSATNYDWGIIGDATGSWDSDQNMTYDQDAKTWSITMDLVVGEMKFRANDNWDWNYGDYGADGRLENGGDNIVVTQAGNYTIVMDLSSPRVYTYSVNLN